MGNGKSKLCIPRKYRLQTLTGATWRQRYMGCLERGLTVDYIIENSIRQKGLSVKTVATDGNCKTSPLNFQWTFH